MILVDDPDFVLHVGDVLDMLRQLPDQHVQMIVTSPPYWGLRDYGVDGQIGLEDTPDLYIEKMVEVFSEARRVLRDDGTLWLNMGDSYAGGGNYRGVHSEDTLTAKQRSNRGARGLSQVLGSAGKNSGCKPKDMVGVPWMLAFALRADGWYLRSDIIWAKQNPMPESVMDRPTSSHEHVFLLAKQGRYFYDKEAIREPADWQRWGNQTAPKYGDAATNAKAGFIGANSKKHIYEYVARGNQEGFSRNKRDVWTIMTEPYPDAHFATFPQALVEPCIKAGSAEGDWVLDPFLGSGTTALVARRLGRRCIGIEINPEYAELAARRLGQQSLLA